MLLQWNLNSTEVIFSAQKASKLAKQMVIWSVISWVIIVAIVVAFYVFAIVLSATTGEWK